MRSHLTANGRPRELLGQSEIISTSVRTGYGGRNSEFMYNYLEITGPNQVVC